MLKHQTFQNRSEIVESYTKIGNPKALKEYKLQLSFRLFSVLYEPFNMNAVGRSAFTVGQEVMLLSCVAETLKRFRP